MSEHHRDTSFKWLMFFFVCFGMSVFALGVWAFLSYNPERIKAVGEPDQEIDRDSWQMPNEVISELKLIPKQVVADIGAGEGYFSFRIAKAEPGVKVYAAEIEDDMVNYVAEIAKEAGLRNLIAFQIDPNSSNLPEKIDLALFVNTYHHLDNRIQYFQKLRSSLRSDGRIAIIDVPPTDSPNWGHQISRDEVMRELSAAGYSLEREVSILPRQFFLIFNSTTDDDDGG